MLKVNWAGAYEDFCRPGLSRAKYAAGSRFQAFYAGRRPAHSTLCLHFKRLAREVPAEKASEAVPASTRIVSVTHLKAKDIRVALAAQPVASKVSPLRRPQANRAIFYSSPTKIPFRATIFRPSVNFQHFQLQPYKKNHNPLQVRKALQVIRLLVTADLGLSLHDRIGLRLV